MHFTQVLATVGALAGFAYAAPSPPGNLLRTVYQFPNATPIENLIQTRKGDLLLSTFSLGRVYSINPDDSAPSPRLVAELPGVGSVTGIAEIDTDIYAVSGGNVDATHTGFIPGSASVFTIDIRAGLNAAVVKKVAIIPQARVLNGMAALPSRPGVILSADHGKGFVYRVDTRTGAVDLALSDKLLAPSGAPNTAPIGVNGLKTQDDQLYFTNSALGIFAHVTISPNGYQAGDVKTVATLGGPAAPNRGFDDFAMGKEVAYVAQEPDQVISITADGKQTTLAGASGLAAVDGPTAVVYDASAKRLLVSTVGYTQGMQGSILEIKLA